MRGIYLLNSFSRLLIVICPWFFFSYLEFFTLQLRRNNCTISVDPHKKGSTVTKTDKTPPLGDDLRSTDRWIVDNEARCCVCFLLQLESAMSIPFNLVSCRMKKTLHRWDKDEQCTRSRTFTLPRFFQISWMRCFIIFHPMYVYIEISFWK